jgi:predicted AlkP superfamily phosphohydrolase/phosphomutase
MTGVNPAKHGIFQWRTYDPTKYTHLDEKVITSERLAGHTFWDALGQAGHHVGVITVPVTYPPWPVNGYMVSGYPCPDAKRNYTYPADWGDSLVDRYNFDADHYLNARDTKILTDGLDMLRKRTDLALDLISQQAIDVCVMVLGEIDRAQHDFFKYADDRFPASQAASPELRDAINSHYKVSDEQVGRLLETLAPDGVVLIISDHGGGPHPTRYFHTNAWLRESGWLVAKEGKASTASTLRNAIQTVRRWLPFEEALRRLLPESIVNRARSYTLNVADVNWSKTRAYRFPMYYPAEGIEINLAGRQPEGCVQPGAECETLTIEIMDALREVRDPNTGETIVSEVYRKEEIYRGPYLDIAPDIVFVCHSSHRAGVELRGEATALVDLASLPKYNGVHTMDGILIAYGKGIAAQKTIDGARLMDIAPTVMHLAGLPVPEDMDGRVLGEILAKDRAVTPIEYADTENWQTKQVELTPEEEADMLDKLRGLGYVE